MISDTALVTGVVCAVFWLIAYIGVIHRGFKDKTFGIPIAALATNISWEAAYGFFVDPFADHIHLASIPWFLLDVVIFWQAYTYGAEDFDNPLIRRYFRPLLFGAVAIAYPIVYFSFYEFHDPDAEYTGFGVNLLMSLLFIAMLLRRNSPRGQSLYIAIAKFVGTFLAWLASALAVTTSVTQPWPDSFSSFVVDTVTHTAYPLTPLINYLYLVIFVVDIAYITMLYRCLKAAGIPPWRHY